MHNEISQTEKDKYCMITLICITHKNKSQTKNKINSQTKLSKNKRANTENRIVVMGEGVLWRGWAGQNG